MKSYEARIARLERILGPRSQNAALLGLVDLLVHAKKAEERQERSCRKRPPKIMPPDEGGRPAQWQVEIKPAGPERVLPPPAFTECCAAPVPPDRPAPPVQKQKTVRETAPIVDLCVFPAHWQFNRGQRAESEDEQRRRMPPLVF